MCFVLNSQTSPHMNTIIPFESLTKDDVVIIPAFGTTLEIESKLISLGISIEKYNTTCPFVEKSLE